MPSSTAMARLGSGVIRSPPTVRSCNVSSGRGATCHQSGASHACPRTSRPAAAAPGPSSTTGVRRAVACSNRPVAAASTVLPSERSIAVGWSSSARTRRRPSRSAVASSIHRASSSRPVTAGSRVPSSGRGQPRASTGPRSSRAAASTSRPTGSSAATSSRSAPSSASESARSMPQASASSVARSGSGQRSRRTRARPSFASGLVTPIPATRAGAGARASSRTDAHQTASSSRRP